MWKMRSRSAKPTATQTEQIVQIVTTEEPTIEEVAQRTAEEIISKTVDTKKATTTKKRRTRKASTIKKK
tara:strand:+ start:297 stop:503 length:207 start_codon:yes stop_codon:yes gene_type:complete